MFSTKIYLIIFLFPVVSLDNHCDKTQNIGPFQLSLPPNTDMNITRTLFSGNGFLGPKSVKVFIGQRSYWNAYCLRMAGLGGDSCEIKKVFLYTPNESELKNWRRRNMCSIGDDYYYEWGSDASKCKNEKPVTERWVPFQIMNKNYDFKNLYHTCYRSWNCEFYDGNLFLDYKVVDTHKFSMKPSQALEGLKINFVAPTTKEIEADPFKEGYWWLSSGFGMISEAFDRNDFKLFKVEASCFGDESTLMNCLLKCDCSINGMVVVSRIDEWHCIRAFCIYLTKNKRQKRSLVGGKASSIDDLNELSNDLTYIQDQQLFNILQNRKEIQEIRGVLVKVINSIAKWDDHLIGAVVQKPFVSRFISPNSFILYPCIDQTEATTNCHNGMKFTNGRWVSEKEDPDLECKNFPAPKNLTLFTDLNLDSSIVFHKKPRGTIADEDTMTWFALRKSQLDQIVETIDIPIEGTVPHWIKSLDLGWVKGLSVFSILSGNIAWAALVISLLALFRR